MMSFRQSVVEWAGIFRDRASARRPNTLDTHIQERAMQLLKQNLSSQQREQYERLGHFDVIGGDSGLRYRILRGSQLNVALLDGKGKSICMLCFVPEGRLTVGDVMLAQKLALELFETDAIEIANKTTRSDRWLEWH
jgi:hypothetical protein